jgi:hypothetical protein
MKKHIVVIKILFLFITISTSNANAKEKFAIITKTFHRDVDQTITLTNSVEKFVPSEIPFYVVIPKAEHSFFLEKFNSAVQQSTIKKIPNILFEEDILRVCGDSVYKRAILGKMHGYIIQQIVKLCFYKMNLAEDYMSIDADSYFISPFKFNKFYKNGILMTVSDENKDTYAKFSKTQIESKVKEYHWIKTKYKEHKDEYTNFIAGWALWSSYNLDKLSNFLKENYNEDLSYAIPEMQNYGQFVYTHLNDRFFPISGTRTFFLVDIGQKKNKLDFIKSHQCSLISESIGVTCQPNVATWCKVNRKCSFFERIIYKITVWKESVGKKHK